jgi:PadR family transcriptional regulator, regulatory protein PadR
VSTRDLTWNPDSNSPDLCYASLSTSGETPTPMPRDPLTVLQGTLDMLVLKALALGPQHGYGITAWIRHRTEGDLDVEDGALYQALHRLENKGWIDAEWGMSENNRRARFYRLTAGGRRELRSAENVWRRYARAVFRVIDTPA